MSKGLAKRIVLPMEHDHEKIAELSAFSPVRALPRRFQVGETLSFSRSWQVTWSELYGRITYFSIYKEQTAYENVTKATRKVPTSELTFLLFSYFVSQNCLDRVSYAGAPSSSKKTKKQK